MGRPEQLASDLHLMSIWYHDNKISVDVLRQMKMHLYKNFLYSRIFNQKQDLASYLGSKLVIKRMVFILSIKNKTEADSIEKMVKRRGQSRGLYRLQLEWNELSTLPNIASVQSFLKTSFDTIVKGLHQAEQSSATVVIQTENKTNSTDEAPLFNTFSTCKKAI
ncbi:unnamed protein product [Rotaria sp. Silwood2]|nr:unnamed protein product [Rotaria sp. Silwood2]CAF2834575.1 unnamed protein product [Rotaria sp. Silwood2]CAF3132165.1 unnamed protein product [Rotaria sp. Silwood2]CAF3950827.1 unnamed protein product [Rotaria sp. Silwood2]CAF4097571.1 unnamed protein product [Rotaria sp. Silwood2]